MKFSEWLYARLGERKWKPADLARESGLAGPVISNLLNEKRNAGVDTCTAIARALDIPREEVYRAAGILDPEPKNDLITETATHLLRQLREDDRQEVLDFIRLKHQRAENSKRDARRHAQTTSR